MPWPSRKGALPLPSHDHDYSSGFDAKSPTCPRCILNAEKTGQAIHTCTHGGAFGKRDMTCVRCRQLAEGVNVATATGMRIRKAREDEAARTRAIKAHRCDAAGCGPVCTFGDW